MRQPNTGAISARVVDISAESRDIVFNPSLTKSLRWGEGYKTFRRRKTKTRWSCKKTTKPGDLHLFYFGRPEEKIAGLAVCSVPPDPAGWKEDGWSNRQKMFFCRFDQLHQFITPIALDELRSNREIDSWWESRPYHGRPKTIPPRVTTLLLQLISNREPKTAQLLKEYIKESRASNNGPIRTSWVDAFEGTLYERLSLRPARSRSLRDAKIRAALEEHHGRLKCEVPGCGFDFLETYGELGRGYAHVHHLLGLAGGRARSTPLSHLAIVCANCHVMIHRGGQCRRMEHLIR